MDTGLTHFQMKMMVEMCFSKMENRGLKNVLFLAPPAQLPHILMLDIS